MSLTELRSLMSGEDTYPTRATDALVELPGVLRLRNVFATEMRYSDQDDNQALQAQDDAGIVDMSGLNHCR